ncbi:MAG TPA: LamG domain-containing protein, partial [Nitrospinaceae bacterium]|nr:LamG domain-containing protein [Nitrospinaceae bacterium]
LTPAGNDGKDWSFAYDVQAGDTGVLDFRLSFTDLVGNTGIEVTQTTDTSSVSADTAMPELSTYALSVNGSQSFTAKPGDTLRVEFTTNEEITTPTIKLAGHEVTASGSGTSWSAEQVLTGSDTEGLVEVELTLTDLTGNTRTLRYPETSNLLASYSFNGNSDDVSENDNNLQAYGGIALTGDRFGRVKSAYQLDGINDYLQSENIFTGLTDELTAEIWFYKPGVWENEYQKLIGTGTGNGWGFMVSQGPVGDMTFYSHVRNLSGTSKAAGTTNSPTPNHWHHVILTYDGVEERLYLDGIKVGEISQSGNISEPGELKIGWVYGTEYFNGKLDDINIFQEALDSSQVLMRSSIVRLDTSTQTLDSVMLSSSNTTSTLAKPGNTLTLDFTSSEGIPQPTVKLAGHDVIPTNTSGDGKTWQATYTVDNTTLNENVSFNIGFSDAAGNVGDNVTTVTTGVA